MTVVASMRALFLVAVLVAGCSEATAPPSVPLEVLPEIPTMVPTKVATEVAPAIPPVVPTEVLPEVPTMVPPKVTLVAPPAAVAPTVRPVSVADLGDSWHPGCPVGPERLRLVEIEFRGFDGARHRGELVVNEVLVDDVQAIFADLLAIGYPIEKVRTPDHYPGAEDELSMEDNNTSAFNCRGIPGSANWSQHAYGRAIDINPLINPSISASGELEPKNAGKYLDRARTDKGLVHDGDPVVQLFAEHGWTWGGKWRDPKDYQHFERPSP